jgi:hypothetical protein
MSVPFIPSVANGAVEVMTDPGLVAAGRKAALVSLQSRFPSEHPLLIGEHLDYAGLLVSSAGDLATQVLAGALSRPDALAKLQSGFSSFPSQSIERALAYGMDAPNNSFNPTPLRGAA